MHSGRQAILSAVVFVFVFLVLPHTTFAALAIDGTAHGTASSGLSATTTLTTTQANDVIIVYAESNGHPTVSVTDTAGLTWTERTTTYNGDFSEWYAIAPSPLSGDVITVTQTSSNFLTIEALGVSGANVTFPFDGPAVEGGGGGSPGEDPISATTTRPNEMVVGGMRENSYQSGCSAGPGFTLINSADYQFAEYQVVSSPTTVSVSQSSPCAGTASDIAADVIVPSGENPSLSIDGHADDGGTFSTSNTDHVTLTTSDPNDVIVLEEFNENDNASTSPYTISNISDTAGLMWHQRTATSSPVMISNGTGSPTEMEVWYAVASNPLSSDTITVTLDGTTDDGSVVAFGVNGADLASPWDSNASIPAKSIYLPATYQTPSVSGVSTNASSVMLLGFEGSGGSSQAGPDTTDGYADIDYTVNNGGTNYSSEDAEYKVISTAASNATISFGSGIPEWFMIGDAIQAAPLFFVDGSNYADDGQYASGSINAPQVTLTTSDPNDIIVLMTQAQAEGGGTVNSVSHVSDTAGLAWQKRSATTTAFLGAYEPDDTEIWWAYASSALSSDTITATMSGGGTATDCQGLIAFGVHGANTSDPWDTNGSLPTETYRDVNTGLPEGAGVTASTSPLSTTASNTMVIGFLSTPYGVNDDGQAVIAPGSGYTTVESADLETCNASNEEVVEYKTVSTPQSGITVPFSASTPANGFVMLGDAIQQGSGSGSPNGRIIRLIGRVTLIGGVRLSGSSPVPSKTGYDSATVAWASAVTTAGGTVSSTQETDVNNLITCYKTAGIFSLMDREWLLWSDDTQQAETDIIHDDTWTSHGTAGFTADAGYTGDGSTSYLDTGFNPSTAGGNYSQNSASLDVYVSQQGASTNNDIALTSYGGCTDSYDFPNSSGNYQFEINGCSFPQTTVSTANGLSAITRTSSSAVSAYKNGALVATSTGNTSETPVNGDFYIGASDDAGVGGGPSHFSNDTIDMAGIGGALTGTQEAAKAACDDAYATSKGFNVF